MTEKLTKKSFLNLLKTRRKTLFNEAMSYDGGSLKRLCGIGSYEILDDLIKIYINKTDKQITKAKLLKSLKLKQFNILKKIVDLEFKNILAEDRKYSSVNLLGREKSLKELQEIINKDFA